jgi:hypothetical protein
MQTRKHALEDPPVTPSSELSNLGSPALIEPSMLHLPTPESYTSVSSPTTSSHSPPPKKQRTRRNAKTDEEKAARAEERALRNRKAAQDSRDRRKRQHEILEIENQRLQKENDMLKQRLDMLEGRITSMEGSQVDMNDGVDEEVGSDFVQTHYPAVVMSYDQPCHTISLPSISPRSSQRPMMPSLRSNTSKKISTHLSISMVSHKTSYSTNLCNFPRPRQVTYSPRITMWEKLLFESYATFDSLNTGSLENGAEIKTEAFFGNVFVSDKAAVTMGGDVDRFGLVFMSLRLVGLLGDNEDGCAGDGIIYRWNTLIVHITSLICPFDFKLVLNTKDGSLHSG